MKDEYRHLFRFEYPIDKTALYREKEIMDTANLDEESADTKLYTVNTDLLERVASGRNVEGKEDIFPKYHDLQDKEKWDNIETWTIRAFGLHKPYYDFPAFKHCHEIKRIADELTSVVGSKGGNDMVPYFLMQEENSEVPPHIDMGFKCAINIIIDGSDTPIYFRDEDGTVTHYNYNAALLNVCGVFHGVPEQKNVKRMILKFRIVDVDYDTALKRMMEYFGDS